MTSDPNNPIYDPEDARQASAVEPGVGQGGEAPAEDAPAPVDADQEAAEPESLPVAAAKEQPQPKAPAKKKKSKAAQVEQEVADQPKSPNMNWYILKIQSNREESIREGLRRRVAIAGLDYYFGDIIVPTEKVTEVKAGKRRTYKRKLYPGYLVVHMEITEETWFLVRETPGIGDFTGSAGHPTPMHDREVASILAKQEEKTDEQVKVNIPFQAGDQVKIKEGTFENFEGEVSSVDTTNGRVTVLINIFGRSTPVDIEYWQIEAV